MSETVSATLPLRQWRGDRGTYHLVEFTGDEAEALSAHAVMQRLEFGRQRGFGSLKVTARIGETQWRTSVFPQKGQGESESWVLLINKKVRSAESLGVGENVEVALTL
ncbi:MAG: DUF1905 domain-containing protein [Erythrobacter sp.]